MKTPQQFYKELGADKLAARKADIYTLKELAYLEKLLSKDQSILDLACGYGRFTIPLAQKGYDIKGLDISPNLIANAKETAKKKNLNIDFRVGDMRKLSYRDDSFDSVICMWSAFSELPELGDQLKSIEEMLRVLKKGGLAFLEMSQPEINKERVFAPIIEGIVGVPMYRHDVGTIQELMNNIKPKYYKITVEDFGGRGRLLVRFQK